MEVRDWILELLGGGVVGWRFRERGQRVVSPWVGWRRSMLLLAIKEGRGDENMAEREMEWSRWNGLKGRRGS
jgi:hypothetical protein